ncbi:hypothetical protein [Actinocrispum wychmicini]|uniref:Uncharacterized protein n=1 Tax=Actinocrispum wychmicini TaxID=1213861 RepID=A0A4R2JMV5_9PSEU|nr:hypothetical protein [Actinocrispum wychmicini]TCO58466.1 hypothetical protein EV192_105535 [Actinocrispum wychmicini]
MRLTAGVPAWVVRATVALAVALIMVLLAAQGVSGILLGVVGVVGALSALVPASPAPAMVIIATAVSVAVVVDDPFGVGVLALLPLVHVVHIGCALTAVIPGTARIHLRALRPVAVRFVLVQTIALGLAGVSSIVPTSVMPTVLEIAGLLAVAGLAAVAAGLILKRPL